MFSLPYSSINKEGIRKAVKMTGKGRYVFLFLHDASPDVTDMFLKHGRAINNTLGSDFTLLTSYDEKIVRDTFMGKDEITAFHAKMLSQPKTEEKRIRNYTIMAALAKEYHVDYLPALIVIDTKNWNTDNEMYYTVILRHKTAAEMADTIIDVIQILRDNYGKTGEIGQKMMQYETRLGISHTTLEEKAETDDDLGKEFKKLFSTYRVNRETLAWDIGVSSRMLRRNTNGAARMSRDRMIAIGVVISIYEDELNYMLRVLGYKDMVCAKKYDCKIKDCADKSDCVNTNRTDRRDCLILNCLRQAKTFRETNDCLIAHDYPPLS